ncbi:hypothetical protein CRG98_027441 [Punica granatum]|uniref:Uncharacterized protein n=1 Tax=Punica granatum TaxID=22663 RepID=A0A2I0J7E9_PUNGR|nr:hypothetical protein CRG98_027441 [Punica granatum]
MAGAPAPPQRAHRVPRRNVRVEDEADLEDELPEEEEQPVPQRQQRGVGTNLKLKIPQFKGTSSSEEYLEWVRRVDKVFECYEYSEEQKCQLAALEFTDYANMWKTPFEVVYGFNPITPLDLAPLPTSSRFCFDGKKRAEQIKALHEQVKKQIKKKNAAYAQGANKGRKPVHFNPGDLVWIHLRKERFPMKTDLELVWELVHGRLLLRLIPRWLSHCYGLTENMPGPMMRSLEPSGLYYYTIGR